ncbi:MAG: redoxin domain-containing protein [Armatimonadia bacterium]|nr:redoxin domain-containing protein [Armatimonadia bacterium]
MAVRLRVVLAAVLLLSAATAALADVDPSEGPPPALARTVPDFTLQQMDGGVVRLGEVQEPVVVLNLFAFWCDTWIQQLPQLRELVTLEDGLGFRLVSVSIDGRWPDQLQQVCGEETLPWPVLLDGDRVLARALGIRHAPTVLVLDRERKVLHAWEGYPGNHRVLRGIRKAASGEGAGE